MDEDRIEELQRHLDFVRSFYQIAGDWGDSPYAKLNELVRFLETELKQHAGPKTD